MLVRIIPLPAQSRSLDSSVAATFVTQDHKRKQTRRFKTSLKKSDMEASCQGTTSVVPISPFYFCHHEEAFRPTRDLLLARGA